MVLTIEIKEKINLYFGLKIALSLWVKFLEFNYGYKFR